MSDSLDSPDRAKLRRNLHGNQIGDVDGLVHGVRHLPLGTIIIVNTPYRKPEPSRYEPNHANLEFRFICRVALVEY
jgi:hypothetical protein